MAEIAAAANGELKVKAAVPPVPPAVAADGSGVSKEVKELTSKDYYFDSYAHFGIHEEMLKDHVRTISYRDAIMKNKHVFKGKIVLDVGCGTGVLSMFAAMAGAKHVYGIECSSIIEQARQIVADNGFADKVTLVKGKCEEVELPVEKVDIIISEWMGYFLFYESMLDTVIFARDKWLAEGGHVLPNKASLHICAIEDEDYRKEKIDFWDDVYGFDMSCIKKVALLEPLVDTVEDTAIISSSDSFMEIDIMTVTVADLAFDRKFRITYNTDDISCHALVAYFDIAFDSMDTKVVFSTSPCAEYTHWKQTVFYFNDVFPVQCGDTLEGSINCKPNAKNNRDLDIDLDFKFQAQGKAAATGKQCYRLR